MSAVLSDKEIHEQLLSEMPEGASHEEAECPFCKSGNSFGGGDMSTYTEDELNNAIKEAVAPVKEEAASKIADLESEISSLKSEADEDAATAELDELKAQLTAAEERATAAEASVTEVHTWLEEQAELVEIAEYLTAVKAERLDAVKEIASFTDEQIEARIDRWTEMSDEDFASSLDDLKLAVESAKASKEETETESPVAEKSLETAMSHTRTSDASTTSDASSVVFGARRSGVAVSKLNV